MDMGCLYAHYTGRGELESTGHWSFSPRLKEFCTRDGFGAKTTEKPVPKRSFWHHRIFRFIRSTSHTRSTAPHTLRPLLFRTSLLSRPRGVQRTWGVFP